MTKQNSKKMEKPEGGAKRRVGMKGKVIISNLLVLIIAFGCMGIFLDNKIIKMAREFKNSSIERQTRIAAAECEKFFLHPFVRMDAESKRIVFRDILQEIESKEAGTHFQDCDSFEKVKSALARNVAECDECERQGTLQMFLASFKASQVITSNGELTDSSYVVEDRTWYKLLQENPGKVIATPIYEDAMTGEMVTTVAAPVFATGTQDMIGAMCVDIRLDTLLESISNFHIGETGYLVVYDNDDNILYHPDSSLEGKNISEIGCDQTIVDVIKNNEDTETIPYQRDGIHNFGSANYVDVVDWSILGVMPKTEYYSEIRLVRSIIVTGCAICMLLLIIAIRIMVGKAINPLIKLNEVARQIAEGEMNMEVDIQAKDEVGDIAESITHIVDRLHIYMDYIDEVAKVMEEIGDGNLEFELKQEYVGEFKRLKAAMLDIQHTLTDTMMNITHTADQVASSAGQVAVGAQSLAQGSTEQASSMEELAATVTDISNHVQGTAKNARDAKQQAAETREVVGICDHQMDEMEKAMGEIGEKSEEIGKIIKVIEDIAFQTNILALNAAVEAARAGSAGKGFAVVADEVRNLAGKSAEASKNTAVLIEASIQAAQNGLRIVNETAESLKQVVEKTKSTTTTIDEIAGATEEQATSIAQVTEGIDQISSVVQTNSATSQESAATSEELSGQAHILKDLISKFHFSGESLVNENGSVHTSSAMKANAAPTMYGGSNDFTDAEFEEMNRDTFGNSMENQDKY